MAKLNYFQTYSQRENHVTNNTLLMLRHIYRSSPLLMEKLLAAILTNDPPPVGLQFTQQGVLHRNDSEQEAQTKKQTPDGYINQAPLHMYVEAKLNGDLDIMQLQQHAAAIQEERHPEKSAFLIGLSARAMPETAKSSIVTYIEKLGGLDKQKTGVPTFFAITYAELVENLKTVSSGSPDLEDIIQDYEGFLESQNLLPDQHQHLVAVLSGRTCEQAVKTGVFFEAADRRPKWHRAHLMGLYHQKKISHIGRICAGITARLDGDRVAIDPSAERFGHLSEEATNRIIEAIGNALEHGFTECNGFMRYYVVEKFVSTHFQKNSSGGLMGHRYINLSKFKPTADTSIEEIAKKLRTEMFE